MQTRFLARLHAQAFPLGSPCLENRLEQLGRGIEGVDGEDFRRVELKDRRRGGVLGMAAVGCFFEPAAIDLVVPASVA